LENCADQYIQVGWIGKQWMVAAMPIALAALLVGWFRAPGFRLPNTMFNVLFFLVLDMG